MVDDTGKLRIQQAGACMDAQFFFVQYTASLGPGIMLAKLAGWHIYFLNKEFLIHIGQIDIFFK